MEFGVLKKTFHDTLSSLYEENEIDAFFYRLTEAYFGYKRLELSLQPGLTIPEAEINRFFKALEQLKTEKPIQYILNTANFYGLEFYVDEHVLIPRPETEELVEWMLTDINAKVSTSETLRIIDIGTGSGCIAITLAKQLPEAKVYALDISEQALEIARKNAKQHEVSIEWIKGDALHLEAIPGTFQYVVSNPPYVRVSEKEQMRNNVLKYEPHTALFVPADDPLIFYKKITQWAVNNLVPGGLLYVEINQYLGEAVRAVFKANGFSNITLKKDLSGNDRMLSGVRR